MQKREDVRGTNVTGDRETDHDITAVVNMELEPVQKLADRVVRDAAELVARIRKEAELEAARLIEDANRRAEEILGKAQRQAEASVVAQEKALVVLRQAKEKATAIETAAIREVAEAGIKIREKVERSLAEVVGRINDELRLSLDHLVESAKAQGDEAKASPTAEGDEVMSKLSAPTILAAEAGQYLGEPRSELPEAMVKVNDPKSEQSPRDETDAAEGRVRVESATVRQVPPQGDLEPLQGEVEIDVAPPINIARLLGVTRYLGKSPNIRVLQTSGSWNLGTTITVSLDRPLPLVKLLTDMPNVADARIAEKQGQSNGSKQNAAKRVVVTLRGAGGV